jgi:hypothetical protein
MKKIVCTLLCALTLALTGCGKDIPALNEIGIDNLKTIEQELIGCDRDDLIRAWGEPDAEALGITGDVWELEGEYETLLNVYYNGDNSYNSALISYMLKYTGTVTEIGDKASENAATFKVTVQLDDGSSVVIDTAIDTVYTGAEALEVGQRANFVCTTMTGSDYVWIRTAEILG